MRIDLKDTSISITAPAKLNLYLEVLGKRPDGYHEVETLMCPISLCDVLEFRLVDDPGIRLQLELPEGAQPNDPAWQIPDDHRNLVTKGVQAVHAALGTTGGCHISLRKSVPAAAGLGGGSSNAAAAVVAAMLAWKKWDRSLAETICNSLGSDIAFFLGDRSQVGMALATGRGEKCENIVARPELEFIVTHPPEGCPTSAVYAGFRIADIPRSSAAIIEACRRGDIDQVGSLLFNSLESSARTLTHWIERQLTVLRTAGCEYTCMSGSGSSCFALVTGNHNIMDICRAAYDAGLPRAYAVKSWYSPSVEEQLRLSGRFS
jgi:4-diphosphocytidyl-2-C-methyl-D-erythritol kinase